MFLLYTKNCEHVAICEEKEAEDMVDDRELYQATICGGSLGTMTGAEAEVEG